MRSKVVKRLSIIVAMVLAALVVVVGGATAVVNFFSGSVTSVQRDITETNATLVPTAAAWHNVPSTTLGVTVPAGTTRLVESTFGAESRCLNTSWCSVRVVAINSAGGMIEFSPVVGTDYAFDTPGGSWEQHSVHRATRLAAGSYRIVVQARLVGPAAGAQFRLDDYTHFVNMVNP